jgi:hypothetical protein
MLVQIHFFAFAIYGGLIDPQDLGGFRDGSGLGQHAPDVLFFQLFQG